MLYAIIIRIVNKLIIKSYYKQIEYVCFILYT